MTSHLFNTHVHRQTHHYAEAGNTWVVTRVERGRGEEEVNQKKVKEFYPPWNASLWNNEVEQVFVSLLSWCIHATSALSLPASLICLFCGRNFCHVRQ